MQSRMRPNTDSLHRFSRRLVLTALLAATACGLTACTDAEDENYLWLLGLANPAAAAGEASGESETVPFTIDVSDINGEPDFLFETTQTVDLFISVVDPVAPVSGSRVRVFELINGSTGEQTLFQAVSDPNGNVQGSFTVNRTTSTVVLEYNFAGQTYRQEVDITSVQSIRRTLNVFATVGPEQIADADGDGIPDEDDAYPEDPTRATIVRFPSDGGVYTVAFEDLYPRQGDADFNDYVLALSYEADLTAAGDVPSLRGEYTHRARGAGYRHELRLTLAGFTDAELVLERFAADATGPDAVPEFERRETLPQFEGVTMLPASNTTIARSNTRRGQSYAVGKRARFAVPPATPVPLAALGSMPFDLHLIVLNTGHEIHFLGRYFEDDGSDRYLDRAGFPWALLLPGDWRWPLERQDIRPAYPLFQDWYASGGEINPEWYASAIDDYVVDLLE